MKIKAGGVVFSCENPIEEKRARTLFTKEEGTIRWLRETLRTGDRFLDVGANVGSYALLAAKLVGPTGHVVAVEPHLATCQRLLKNIRLNPPCVVTVLSVALSHCEGFSPFYYASAASGSSGSQIGRAVGENGSTFSAVAQERKFVTTVDRLCAQEVLGTPFSAKIDVDGQEPLILAGMAGVLAQRKVRRLLVEIHPHTEQNIVDFLGRYGYTLRERQYTANGKAAIAGGAAPMVVPYNGVFDA